MKKFTFALFISLIVALLLVTSVSAADVKYEGTTEDLTWKIYDDGELVISGTAEMPDFELASGKRAPWYSYRSLITEITIKSGVKSLGDYAFYGLTKAEIVTVPRTVKSLGDRVFAECKLLEQVSLPNTITSMGTYVFENCAGLEKVTLPSDLSSVNTGTFYGCVSLEKVNMPEAPTRIRSKAFYDCASLYEIVIPYSVTELGEGSFVGCVDLEEMYFLGDAPTLKDSNGPVFEDTDDLYIYYMDGAAGFTKGVWRTYNVEEYDGDDYEYGVAEDEETDEDDWISDNTPGNTNSSSNKKVKYGDLNEDDKINSADLRILRNCLSNQKNYDMEDFEDRADVDDDGEVSVIDYIILARYIDGWKGYKELPY